MILQHQLFIQNAKNYNYFYRFQIVVIDLKDY